MNMPLQFMATLPAASPQPVMIDIISDVICPWCFIGKRRLERALATLPEIEASVRWRPYLLDHSIPEGGIDRRIYLRRKFGRDGGREVYERIRAAGAEESIPFAFGKIKKTPNTLDAHRLLHWAEREGGDVQDRVAERLFEEYFVEGEDIGDRDVLANVAGACGMNAASVRKRLETNDSREAVLRQIAKANEAGVTGVPCFIFNRTAYLPGAQSAEVLADAIRRMVSSNGTR